MCECVYKNERENDGVIIMIEFSMYLRDPSLPNVLKLASIAAKSEKKASHDDRKRKPSALEEIKRVRVDTLVFIVIYTIVSFIQSDIPLACEAILRGINVHIMYISMLLCT